MSPAWVCQIFQSCQTWPAKFGQILLKTDTRLVFCIRKLMRSDIFFTRTTKHLWNFVNPVSTFWGIHIVLVLSIHLSVTKVCTHNSSYILKENSVKLYMLANYLKENGIWYSILMGPFLKRWLPFLTSKHACTVVYVVFNDLRWEVVERFMILLELWTITVHNTVKSAHVITSIKQSPVLEGHIFLVLS